MITRSKLLAFLAPTLLLSGCGGTVNRGLESVHQPVVERNDYAFDVATSGYDLAPGEAQRLNGWLTSLRVGYGDRIAVEDSGGGTGVRDAVAVQAARLGLLVTDEVPITVGPLAAGTARVIVSRMSASVPGCPDHSRVSGTDFNGNTWSNYGCATNSNLAAMVARPEDLVRGQPGSGTADATTSYKAINSLRKAEPTGAQGMKADSTKGGN
jgi:pilus assembly protein CpaD